ncbi:MAG: hypothetical protein HGA44_15080 [Cellulomonadaceae bacterium]|nr:hypothetical protein [Cellulomonadaceae bacterium]
MSLFNRARPQRDDPAPAAPTAPVEAPPGNPADGQVVSPARTPKLPEGWTYRFASPGMGDARINLLDHRGRVVAVEKFVGHAGSPDFVISAACTNVHATWKKSGGVVFEVQNFTASANREGDGWRVWCNQALGVTFLVDDVEQAAGRMVQALAEAKGLEPEEVHVTMVANR